MPIPAHLENVPPAGNITDRADRRTLRLETSGSLASGEATNVVIHNVSAGGLLLGCSIALAIDEAIDVELPHAGTVRARVVWESGQLFGCAFDQPISAATLSAAELRSAVGPAMQVAVQADMGAAAFGADYGAPADPVKTAPEAFGSRLRRLRKERRMTMAQLGAQLGVSKPTIWAWEQGKARPLGERMAALAQALGIEEQDLKTSRDTPALVGLIASSRQQIAAAYGTTADKVRIMIEL
ncbi:helix-turn-helix domain-containing protein [Altererythrobacter confluentis]|uniref:Helix-turn-helix domain-containing protein n=1 Tax=Allopontixanthobacter confluentis TaxID=1849021 RepID=A0A6L7GCH1_9SPHN|nr:helix-turn-helix domain-containing protein [Allopontixanthobacter confluentis]